MDIKRLKQLLLLLIIIFIGLCGIYFKYTCEKNAKRFYAQGQSLYEKEKYSDAYYNFKQIKPLSRMYELSLLKQYQCAQKLNDKKTAHTKLKEIIKTTKNEHIKPWAQYSEAILSKELNTSSDSMLYKKFRYIQETYKENDFAIASAYQSARLSKEKTPNLAKENYLKYLSYAPIGKYAQSALDDVLGLNCVFNKEDYEIIADSELALGQYKNALENYQKTSFSKNWYKISKCHKGLNDKNSEKETILKGLTLNSSDVSEKDVSAAIERLVAISLANKTQLLQDLYTKYPNSYILPTVAYKLAQLSSPLRAIKLYELVANEHSDSIWASNALWEVFWHNYQESRFKTCEKIAQEYKNLYPKTQDAPRIAYWGAKALLKSHKNQQAKEVFYDIINNYPLSYYSFLSARGLKMSKAKKMIVKKTIVNYDRNSLNKVIFKDKTLLRLADMNDWELIDEFKINDEYVKSWIAFKKENCPLGINLAKKELLENKDDIEAQDEKINFSNQLLKMVYPIFYHNEINNYAQASKQSPYLFLSLTREESHFDKNAKSSAGAYGLSQLLNATADFIEKKPVSKETLFNPEENIRIGLRYFSYLNDYFKNDEYLAILAYNAGPGNVNKWLNDSKINTSNGEIDVFVENIPYLETKNYIKKILSSYWVYLNIYSAKNK